MFFKGKWKVWITILVLCITYSAISKVISNRIENKKEKEPVTYTIRMVTGNQLLNIRVATSKEITIGKQPYLFKNTETEPDIIITEKTDGAEFDGYSKLDGFLYTSFTMFTSGDLYNSSDEGWLTKVQEDGRYKYIADIRQLLEAVENDKTWRDLGVMESSIINNVDKKVNFSIPNKYHYSYPYLRGYIAFALNDYQPIEEENLTDFLTRADMILSKAEKCEVVNCINDSEWKGILLAPEAAIADCGKEFLNSSHGIINPGTTLKIEYDVFIKPDKMESFKLLSVDYRFLNLFGLRSVDGNSLSSNYNYFRRCFEVIDFIKPEDRKEWQQMMEISTGVPYNTEVVETTVIASENSPAASKDETNSDELSETENQEQEEQINEEQESQQGNEENKGSTFGDIMIIIIFLMIVIVLAFFGYVILVYC